MSYCPTEPGNNLTNHTTAITHEVSNHKYNSNHKSGFKPQNDFKLRTDCEGIAPLTLQTVGSTI